MEEGTLVPVSLFLVSGIVAIAWFYFSHKNRERIMDTVQKAMESGSDLTPELLTRLGAALNPAVRDLRRGIVIGSIGVAGLLCSFFVPPVAVDGVRAGSLFPLLIGAAFLLVWRLTREP